MQKKYVVRLTDDEREALNRLVAKPRVCAQKVRRARVLLKADADGPNWSDAKIAEAFDCRAKSVENIRQRLVTEGFDVALHGRPKRRVRGKVLDGEQEAKVIALRLGQPPLGSPTGRCVCWPSRPWHWRSWSRSATKPCAGC